MPKAKRSKLVSLTKTRKNAMELKRNLVDVIRSCIDRYANLFIFRVNDMRNSKLKEVRDEWKDSRFFLGKNKVMAIALGRTPSDEYQTNLSEVSRRLKGPCGLLFSNKTKDEVTKWFDSYSEATFARSGNVASYTVKLPEGPLPEMHHSMEPYIRSLGLPTKLDRGVVHVIKEYLVCNEGETLTPEKAKILELLGHKMAEFHITIACHWANSGTFTVIDDTPSQPESSSVAMDVVDDASDNDDQPTAIDDDKESSHSEMENDDKDAAEEQDEVELPVSNGDHKTTTEAEVPVPEPKMVDSTSDISEENAPDVDEEEDVLVVVPEESVADEAKDEEEKEIPAAKGRGRRSTMKRKLPETTPVTRKSRRLPENVPENSPDEKSPLFRSLRNRTVKVKRTK